MNAPAIRYDGIKRVIDATLATFALFVLLPLLVLIYLAVRIDSTGPGFFRQERVGRGGRPFLLYKFRTMRDRDASKIDHRAEAVFSGEGNPLITRVGRILRKTSLDELPQLWNIIRGDMSVVGPRPVLPDQLPAIHAQGMKRFEVRPGLTGLAQIMGRQSLTWLDKLDYDVRYVQTWGLWFDLCIILRTVWIVLTARGTYYAAEGSDWRAYLPEPGDGTPAGEHDN